MVVMYISRRGSNTCTARPLTFKGLNTEILIKINKHTTGATSGAGTVYPSGAPEGLPRFLVGFMLLNLQFYVYVLQFVICPFVPFLLAIVLFVLLRYTNSDYHFGIFKPFFQLECVHKLVKCLSSSFLLVVIKKDNLLSAADKTSYLYLFSYS